MKKQNFAILVCFASLLVMGLSVTTSAFAGKPEKLSTMRFVVLRDYNGKPIRNAAVVLHPVGDTGKQKRSGLELKADGDGKASYDGVPYGNWRIQVLSQGFQTYGEDYEVNKPEMEITVKLKRPQEQYSIYKDHPEEKSKDDAAKDTAKDKSKPAPDADKPKTDGNGAPKK